MAATIMARSGVSKPWKGFEFDGVDLLPFLTGEKQDRPHQVLYWRRGEDYAIRQGDWKLAWNDQSGPQTIRLFNLADDRKEEKDLIENHPEIAKQMKAQLEAFKARTGSRPECTDPAPVKAKKKETRKQR